MFWHYDDSLLTEGHTIANMDCKGTEPSFSDCDLKLNNNNSEAGLETVKLICTGN